MGYYLASPTRIRYAHLYLASPTRIRYAHLYNDVRILIEEENFNELCKQAKAKFTNGYMDDIDIKIKQIGITPECEKIKYVYFGWNCIRFDDEETEWIEQFVKNLNEFHFVRIGESWDDLDEHYNLNKTNVDCIQVTRCFNDPIAGELNE
jgi:hypothetical protein